MAYLVGTYTDNHLFHSVVKVVQDRESHEIVKVWIDVYHTLQGIATGLNDVANDAGMATSTI